MLPVVAVAAAGAAGAGVARAAVCVAAAEAGAGVLCATGVPVGPEEATGTLVEPLYQVATWVAVLSAMLWITWASTPDQGSLPPPAASCSPVMRCARACRSDR